MCGVHLKCVTANAELDSRLGIEYITVEADCGGLVMLRERIVMIGFQYVEVLKLEE